MLWHKTRKFNVSKFKQVLRYQHCMKSVCNRGFFGPYFPYEKIRSISPYSVQMWENTDQKNSEYRHFSCSATDHAQSTIITSITISIAKESRHSSDRFDVFKKHMIRIFSICPKNKEDLENYFRRQSPRGVL